MRESANTGRIRLSPRNHFSSVLEETREADTRKKAIQHKIIWECKNSPCSIDLKDSSTRFLPAEKSVGE